MEEHLRTIEVGGRTLAAAVHEASGDAVVLFCHGFRGERTGPARSFVAAARSLATRGIASIRFDQYGSGDSSGEFLDSRFDDWVDTIAELARRERRAGKRVGLLGQSMGASAAIRAARSAPVDALVAWVPDPNVDPFTPDARGFVEEGGQRVANAFWEQAHAADIPDDLAHLAVPAQLVFGTADDYVSAENREALVAAAGPEHTVDVLEGWTHSGWTADQQAIAVERSVRFLADRLSADGAGSAGRGGSSGS